MLLRIAVESFVKSVDNNHSTLDCKRCLPWKVRPELCAAQVEDQSFFYIDECIDARVAKEKSSTTVIIIIRGAVNTEQIKLEFMNLIGADAWRWHARQVADGKFLMRIPTARMVAQWSNLKNLTMRNEAQIKIEAWTPAVGAKGVLQSAWFWVGKIPADQRSVRTLAKVGGLRGKVIEIDEGSRYRYDYVRLKIACRDVTRVPKTAEGTLGMYIIDFEFEREVPKDAGSKVLKSGIVVSEDTQPPAKKSKADLPPMNQDFGNKERNIPANQGVNQRSGKQIQEPYWSAPPKMDYKSRSQSKLMGDAQKGYNRSYAEGDGGKVHIPETFKDLDSDSDSFADKVKQLTGMNEDQAKKGNKGESSKQMWFVKDIVNEIDPKSFLPATKLIETNTCVMIL